MDVFNSLSTLCRLVPKYTVIADGRCYWKCFRQRKVTMHCSGFLCSIQSVSYHICVCIVNYSSGRKPSVEQFKLTVNIYVSMHSFYGGLCSTEMYVCTCARSL